jgi:proton-translocating NADH-quinone oxidoreductase chain N|tara:strand:- start:2450 stop:3943 length:1494 start_codon:yes stop_codon:yes gene_type:complete
MDFNFNIDWIAALPEIYIFIIINFLIVYAVIYSTSPHLGYPILIRNVTWLGVQILVFALLLNLLNPITGVVAFNNLLIFDSFSILIKSILLLSTIVTLILALDYSKFENLNCFEYVILMILAVTGMMLVVSSYDLISMYLAIELQSFCMYIIASLKRESEFSTEAGLKYFILGAFSSGLLLFGCSLLYGFTGTTNYQQLFQIFSTIDKTIDIEVSNAIILGVLFILVGMLFKLSAAPFHLWAPDVYEGAPTSVTAFFAIVPKIAILSLVVRLFSYVFYGLLLPWQEVLILCSIISMIIGTLGALWQTKIKRLLAYSGIGHIGYMLIGISTGSIEGIYSTFFYVIIYIIMTVATFSILLSIRKQGNLSKIKYINDLSGLFISNPQLALSFSLIMFSMCGIPPLAGFFSKMFIFISAINMEMYFLAIIGVMTSVVASFYYIRIIKLMFFDSVTRINNLNTISKENSLFLSFCCIFLMSFFLWPTPIALTLHNSVMYLCI